ALKYDELGKPYTQAADPEMAVLQPLAIHIWNAAGKPKKDVADLQPDVEAFFKVAFPSEASSEEGHEATGEEQLLYELVATVVLAMRLRSTRAALKDIADMVPGEV
ncbi:unnamed protein product, partial [Polarella glacialis]